MKTKKNRKPTPSLAPPAPAPAPRPVLGLPAPAGAFIVAVEGFDTVKFARCSNVSADSDTLSISREIRAGDSDISNWWNAKDARKVVIFVLGVDGKPIRSFQFGHCVPKNFTVGPFDRGSNAWIEETLTITRITVAPAPAPSTSSNDN